MTINIDYIAIRLLTNNTKYIVCDCGVEVDLYCNLITLRLSFPIEYGNTELNSLQFEEKWSDIGNIRETAWFSALPSCDRPPLSTLSLLFRVAVYLE